MNNNLAKIPSANTIIGLSMTNKSDDEILKEIKKIRQRADMELKKERERIKVVIERKIEDLIVYREKQIKRKLHVKAGVLRKLKRDIIFLIDNPDYVRVKDR